MKRIRMNLNRLFATILSMAFLCSGFNVEAQAAAPANPNIHVKDGIIAVEMGEDVEGKISIILYQDNAVVYQAEKDISSDAAQIPLPVRQLPLGAYTLSVFFTDKDENASVIKSLTIETGTVTPTGSSGSSYASYPSQTPATSRAVMVPYAKVFSSDSMTGTPLAELKRHDLVSVISDNGTISQVKCTIQSGNGSISNVDNVNAEYSSSDDLVVTGYMYNSAFTLPLTSAKPDLQREVVELAYSRLGLKGVYSQAKRYIDYYTDCSALASWCWFQVGVDFTNYGTACSGIASWADDQSSNVILWDGIDETHTPQAAFSTYKAANNISGDLYFSGSFDGIATLPESSIVAYMQNVDQDVLDALEPGDLIFFNHYKTITDQYGGSFRYQVNEDIYGRSVMGYDHVAVFVGKKNSTTMTVIESSSPSTDPGQNTKLSEITLNSSRAKEIAKIIRPTGCTQIDPMGIYASGYSGIYHDDIGNLKAPVPGLNASTKGNITGGSRFGYRIHPIWGTSNLHTGVDLSGNVGATYGTPVSAALDGEVIYISNTCTHNGGKSSDNCCNCGGGYGNYVIIQHNDTTTTLYAHMQSVSCSIGQTVTAGAKIGEVGSSGYSTGAHLHFEVRYNGVPTDPLQYIK